MSCWSISTASNSWILNPQRHTTILEKQVLLVTCFYIVNQCRPVCALIYTKCGRSFTNKTSSLKASAGFSSSVISIAQIPFSVFPINRPPQLSIFSRNQNAIFTRQYTRPPVVYTRMHNIYTPPIHKTAHSFVAYLLIKT